MRKDPLLSVTEAMLLFALLLLSGFAGGFYFDRYLHRPIEIKTYEQCGQARPV